MQPLEQAYRDVDFFLSLKWEIELKRTAEVKKGKLSVGDFGADWRGHGCVFQGIYLPGMPKKSTVASLYGANCSQILQKGQLFRVLRIRSGCIGLRPMGFSEDWQGK